MKKYSLHFVLILSITTIFSSCRREDSDDIMQSSIYKEYEIEYNGDQNKTKVLAFFRIDNSWGTKIRLEDPSEIKFNGANMTWHAIYARYVRNLNGAYLSGNFTYTNNHGQVRNQFVELPNTINVPSQVTSIKKGEGTLLNWEGAVLQNGEEVEVTIKDENNNQLTQKVTFTGASFISVDENKLNTLSNGTIKVSFKRTYSDTFQTNNSAGGSIKTTYISPTVYLTLE